MSSLPHGETIDGALTYDPEIATLLSDPYRVEKMLQVETALSLALGEVGLIPKSIAQNLCAGIAKTEIKPEKLIAAMATNGIPTTGLLSLIKENLDAKDAGFLHWGATSQDITDSAQALINRRFLEILIERFRKLIATLQSLMSTEANTVMLARTRGQSAIPITFGFKVATWLAPTLRQLARFHDLTPRLIVAQLGGAAGSLAAYGDKGPHLLSEFSLQLGLNPPTLPWHNQRDMIVEFGSALALLAQTCGKIGTDLLLLSQREVGEVSLPGGGSSTMPQKRNPIAAEQLDANAQLARNSLPDLYSAMAHRHERGGTELYLEWSALPRLMRLAAHSLNLTTEILTALDIHRDKMRQNVAADGGVLSEAAAFQLAAYEPLPEARQRVAAALQNDPGASIPEFVAALQETCDFPIDWDRLADPANYLGAIAEFIDSLAGEADDI